MKVKCINNAGWERKRFPLFLTKLFGWKACDGPKYGGIFTVVNSYWDEGVEYFDLLEWPQDDAGGGWEADQFEPLEELYEKVSVSEIKEVPCVN